MEADEARLPVVQKLKAQKKSSFSFQVDQAMGVEDATNPSDVALRISGDHARTGPMVPRGFVSTLTFENAQETLNPKPDRSIFQFKEHGQAGLPVSELFPHLARHTEKLCLLHGMHSDSPDHINAAIQLHCGKHLSSHHLWVLG